MVVLNLLSGLVSASIPGPIGVIALVLYQKASHLFYILFFYYFIFSNVIYLSLMLQMNVM